MKEYEELINYLTDIILRPHRQIYGIQKLGPSKIVVKSHEKSISVLQSMSRNEKHIPKQMQQNYCELIEVNRREVTIKSGGRNIQASIYQPQLTNKQNKNPDITHNNHKTFIPAQVNLKSEQKYQNCVILLHANSGSRIEGTQYVKHVLQYRTLCVSFDYSGSGISQGQYTTMGVIESEDLSNIINYIAQNYEVKRFSLWGRSMGAVTGVYYLLTKYKQDVKKIRVVSCVIDSPFSNLQQLILQIASQKSNLPQFVFQPLLKILEKEIISKVGVNIFFELNLIEKMKKLTLEETMIINSVSFLGLASKEDTMINYKHCQELSNLLISQDVRSSDLIDEKNCIVNSSSDKHLMMLAEFKKELNTKGDFIYIQGDHNKPRSNQVKEKISYFIHDNFYSYIDAQLTPQPMFNVKQQPKPISFTKTGMNIKTKLSFAKSSINTSIKVIKDSAMTSNLTIQQNKRQESIPRHNYNLINLKEIKAKHSRKSLTKQKETIPKSLNTTSLLRERIDQPPACLSSRFNDNVKGLNIVSREYHKDKIKSNQQCQVYKKVYESLKNYNNTQNTVQNQNISFSRPSVLKSFLNKGKQVLQSSQKYKYQTIKKKMVEKDQDYSNNSGSVNNSIKQNQSTHYAESHREKVVMSALGLKQNDLSVSMEVQQNFTQRENRAKGVFERQQSEKLSRNFQSKTFVSHKRLDSSPEVSTKPFNLSIETKIDISIDVQNFMEQRFRKKQAWQIQESEDSSVKKQVKREILRTPKGKISISQFISKQQEMKKSVSKNQNVLLRKENNLNEANWGIQAKRIQRTLSFCTQDKLCSMNPLQFRKRQLTVASSINNSLYSYEQSSDMMRSHNKGIKDNKRQRVKTMIPTHNYVQNLQKPQSVTSSFSQSNNDHFIKHMVIDSGQKNVTQSSIFNDNKYQNGFYQPTIPHPTGESRYMLNNPFQYVNQSANSQYILSSNDNSLLTNNGCYPYPVNGKANIVMNSTKSMKVSQNIDVQNAHRTKEYYVNNKVSVSGMEKKVFFQTNPQSQLASHRVDPNFNEGNNLWYAPQQGSKKTLEYKKKITRLLD